VADLQTWGSPAISSSSGRRHGGGRSLTRSLLVALAVGLVAVVTMVAGFGWLDALRALGALHVGPRVPDALPLRRLAGTSAQPLLRVVVAWASVGLGAGAALARLPRLPRLALLTPAALALIALASELAFAVEETEGLDAVLSTRLPGSGVIVEALVLALAASVPGRRHGSTDPQRLT